ncbi:hypothetical protein BDV59DRAFT_198088 [Aspergillus ambiguus]|uniref:uncharacterized protein n=1 Tax=Aspergillus ambiguus TaxID=176160 RepID=UPI003CCD82D2
MDERRLGFPRFWTEPNVPGSRLRMQRALTALEVAAKAGNPEIVRYLAECGSGRNETDVPISTLSTSSPVHEAIAAGQVPMLRHLLSTCGYSPNYCPRAAPTVALPPLSYAIVRCDINNPGVQRCIVDLLTHPQLDANLRTPIFSIHPLRFATAHHNPELLSWLAGSIRGGLNAAGVTALGHTLLHVASLPLTGWQVDAGNSSVAESVRCIHTLDSCWASYHLPSPPMTEIQQQAQTATIKVLLERGGCDVRTQEADGNTALHYLAGTFGYQCSDH